MGPKRAAPPRGPAFRALLALPLFLAALAVGAQSQDSKWITLSEPSGRTPPGDQPLPRRFRELELGMGLDALKGALQKDGLFQFRGDRDVSFLPLKEQNLVETTGFSFVRRAFFQLHGGAVFIMALSLDPALIDHYSVFTTFVSKYGEPVRLDPKQAVWENEETRVSIERPLTVKYIDMRVFKELVEESKVEESGQLFLRRELLNDF